MSKLFTNQRPLLAAGYSVIENCFAPAQCEEVIAQWSTLTGVGTRCLLEHPWCQSLAKLLKQQLTAALPGLESLVVVQCTSFNKSSAGNWFVGYHQDRSIPVASSAAAEKWPGWSVKEGVTFVQGTERLLSNMLALRLHFDDSTLQNGPLRVIPNSHSRGILSPPEIEAVRSNSAEVSLTVGRGGVVAMRPLLLHASAKSRIMGDRRVLHFLLAPPTPGDGLRWRATV